MRVKVTEQNIKDYGLDKLTGNSTEDLLAEARKMELTGHDLWVSIPDVEGGDTEAPEERNVFEHFNDDLPEPEGKAHEQQAINLSEQKVLCTFHGCDKPAIWTRKPGWFAAPGSPPGDVCDDHHCWTILTP